MITGCLPKVSAHGWPDPEAAMRSPHLKIRLVFWNTAAEPPNLSPRQLAVLKTPGEGATKKAIAGSLKISENTVKSHLRSIFEGLGVRTRTACVHKVVLLGLVQFACRCSRARSRAARSVSLSAGFGMIVTSSRSAALAKSQTSPDSRPPGATYSRAVGPPAAT